MTQGLARAGEFTHAFTVSKITTFSLGVGDAVSPNMALAQMSVRPALLIRVEDAHGCFGWGEIWANFPPRAHFHKAHLIEDVISPEIVGLDATEPIEVTQHLRARLGTYFLHVGQLAVFEHLLAGIDMALWDLALRGAGKSFADHMKLQHTSVPCYASSINADDMDAKIKIHADFGQEFFKLKIGFGEDQDLANVSQAAKMLPKDARLMVDSNQRWGLDEAIRMLESLSAFAPHFSEEPIRADAGLRDWEKLAKRSAVCLAAGENIYGIKNFLDMANAGVAYLQPDVAKWGGVTGALELARQLPDGVKLWPHFMGSAVGQMAALCVAAAGGDDSVCEMDVNRNALRTELCGDRLGITDGKVALPSNCGLVFEPYAELIKEWDAVRG